MVSRLNCNENGQRRWVCFGLTSAGPRGRNGSGHPASILRVYQAFCYGSGERLTELKRETEMVLSRDGIGDSWRSFSTHSGQQVDFLLHAAVALLYDTR